MRARTRACAGGISRPLAARSATAESGRLRMSTQAEGRQKRTGSGQRQGKDAGAGEAGGVPSKPLEACEAGRGGKRIGGVLTHL